MRLTLQDIAKKVGVSAMTVSRAINPETRKKVSPATLELIDDEIRRTGFQPNIAARHLRKTATKIVGVIFPYYPGVFYSTYYSHILSGVADYIANTEYQFKLILLKQRATYWDNFDFSGGEKIDGMIVTHWTQVFSTKSSIEQIDLPCVLVNDYEKGLPVPIVYGDSYGGGRQAAEYLFERGHRRIAVLNGPTWSRDTQQRLQGLLLGEIRKQMEKARMF